MSAYEQYKKQQQEKAAIKEEESKISKQRTNN